MSRVLALTRRELGSYFFAPVPYVVMFFFLILTWIFFQGSVFQFPMGRRVADVSYSHVFDTLHFILIFLLPLLTMNTVAEERSRNTLETLLTAPVHDWQVILSKWTGAFCFYVTMLAPTLVYWAILAYLGQSIGKPDPGPVASAYLGAMLLGGLYIAIGIFASALTENALLSAFFAFFVLLALIVAEFFPGVDEIAWLRAAAGYVNPHKHLQHFLNGLIAPSHVFYFVSMTAYFLFLAVRALESRKWR